MQYRACAILSRSTQLGAQRLAQTHTMAFRVAIAAEVADMQKARLFLQSRAERDLLLPPMRTRPRSSLISPPPCRFPVPAAARFTVPRPLKPPQAIRTQPTRPQAEAQADVLRTCASLGCRYAQRCQTSYSSATSAAPSTLPGWHVEAVRMKTARIAAQGHRLSQFAARTVHLRQTDSSHDGAAANAEAVRANRVCAAPAWQQGSVPAVRCRRPASTLRSECR
jgi:hypothetical protein